MVGRSDPMDDAEMGAGETAISYTDQFVDAAVAKLDATFGKGYAAKNPAALGAYVSACATNLGAFMTASAGMLDVMAGVPEAEGGLDMSQIAALLGQADKEGR